MLVKPCPLCNNSNKYQKGKKTMKRLGTMLLALMMVMSLAMAQGAENRVLATVNGREILQEQADAIMPRFNGMNQGEGLPYRDALEVLVGQEMLRVKISDMGFDKLDESEEAALKLEAEQEWKSLLDQYVQFNLSEDTDEARQKAQQQAEEFWKAKGVDLARIESDKKLKQSVEKMRTYLLGGYTPSQEEIDGVFQTVGRQYQAQFENDISMYETMTNYSGQKSWYTPEGYRGILHILIKVDPKVHEQFTAMQAAYEEQHSKNEGSAEKGAQESVVEPITEEQLEQARQTVLDSKKDVIDDIYARLEKGESFESLIEAYGEDPGMQQEDYLKNGYSVHKDSIIFDPAFTKGAFQEKMQKVGDVSDPVVGSFGIHILKYHRDVPSGLIMTDAIHQEIEEYLIGKKENEAFEAALEQWKASMSISYEEENIKLAAEQYAETLKQEEENAQSTVEAAGEAAPEASAETAPEATPEAAENKGN